MINLASFSSSYQSRVALLKLCVSVLLLLSLCVVVFIVKERHYYDQGKKQALEWVKTIVAIKRIDRIKYSDEINRLVDSRIGISTSHNHLDKPLVSPNPATFHFETCEQVRDVIPGFNGCTIFSDFPWPTASYRNPLNERYEKNALNALKESNEAYTEFIIEDGQEYAYYSEVMVMNESCVDCHNNHPLSPKKDWVSGEPRGREGAAVALKIQRNSIFEVLLSLLLVVIAGLVMYMYVTRRREENTYKRLTSDEYGIDGLVNKSDFINTWDSICSRKTTFTNNKVLLLSVYIKHYNTLLDEGEDILVDRLSALTVISKQLAPTKNQSTGRYEKHIIASLLVNVSRQEALDITGALEDAINASDELNGDDYQVTGVLFVPEHIADCQLIFKRIETPLLDNEGFNFVSLTEA